MKTMFDLECWLRFLKKFFYLSGSSYSGSELDKDSRQIVGCNRGRENNYLVGAADEIF